MSMNVRKYLEHAPRIGKRVFIDATAAVIGKVSLGDDVSIWPMTVVRGDVNTIEIGARSNIQDACVLHVTRDSEASPGGFALTVGEDVTVGHRVTLHGCRVGDRCLVGMGATIMDGAVVEDDVLLAACCLVTPGKRLQAGHLYRGSPARKIRPLKPDELEMLPRGAAHYVALKSQYLLE